MEAVTGSLFAQQQHNVATDFDISLHEREIRQLNLQVKEAEESKANRHRQSMRWRGVYHLQNTFYRVDIARRDAVRDAIRHKSSSTHSFMVVSSILISCLFAIIYQFQPPEAVSDTGLVILMVFMGCSLTTLVASVRVALSLQSTLSSYHVHRPLHHYKPCNKVHTGFNDFNACHCESKEWWSSWLMIWGAVFTLASGAVYQFLILSEPQLNYHITLGGTGTATSPVIDDTSPSESSLMSEGPGVVFAVLCFGAICALLLGELLIDSRTHRGPHDYTGFLNKEQWVERARDHYMTAAAAAQREQQRQQNDGSEIVRGGGGAILPAGAASVDIAGGVGVETEEDGSDSGGGHINMNMPDLDDAHTREPLY